MSTKRTDGRLVKAITDVRTGKRIYFYGSSEREINKKILEYNTLAERGRLFSEVSDEWWAEAEPKLAQQSVRRYTNPKERADLAFGDTPIKNITPKHIQRYIADLASLGYSQKSVAQYKLVLNRIFKHAVVQGDIEYNPCVAVEIPKHLSKKTREAATSEEERLVKASADVWLFPYMALMTGMRKGELLALQWKDIDFEHNVIRVEKSISHDGDKPTIVSPKTEAGNRIVPLLVPLKETLLKISARPKENFIISDDGKSPLSNRRYCTLMAQFQSKVGVKCTAHQLRHSFATIAFEADLDPKTVQEILGHKQLSTTMDIYTSFREKALKSAAERLNNIM